MTQFRRFARATFRGGVVWYLSWHVLYFAWLQAFVTAQNLAWRLGPSAELAALLTPIVFSTALGLYEFWRAYQQDLGRRV